MRAISESSNDRVVLVEFLKLYRNATRHVVNRIRRKRGTALVLTNYGRMMRSSATQRSPLSSAMRQPEACRYSSRVEVR